MTLYTHKKKEILERIERLSSTDYAKKGIIELERKGYRFNLSHPLEVERLKQLLNEPRNTSFKSMRGMDGFCFWDKQKVGFVRSNLGYDKGSIFYFICNVCNQRVKYLYEYNSCYSPICRRCCHLGYKYLTRKSRMLSRLIHKPYLSSEDKWAIIKYAGITKEDLSNNDFA